MTLNRPETTTSGPKNEKTLVLQEIRGITKK